jgi:hypothetical protein
MKNLKFYWLILLIAFAVSFALPANAQAKKVRKKAKVVKKKVARKRILRNNKIQLVKIGDADFTLPNTTRYGSDGRVVASDDKTPKLPNYMEPEL